MTREITLKRVQNLRGRIAKGERDLGIMGEVDGLLSQLEQGLTPLEEETELVDDDGDEKTPPVKKPKKKNGK